MAGVGEVTGPTPHETLRWDVADAHGSSPRHCLESFTEHPPQMESADPMWHALLWKPDGAPRAESGSGPRNV